MKLLDFVVKEAVTADLASTDRNGVIRELVALLVKAGAIAEDNAEAIVKMVLARENAGSTGFGKGVAVPHVKHSSISKIMAAVGRSAAGVDFTALDRAPVYTVVLLCSPDSNPDGHLQAMENIFKHLTRDNFRRFLRQSETSKAIIELFEEADQSVG